MARINRFEEIEAWQDARRLANMVYEAARQTPLSRDFGLRDQITRAAVSVMANIAEGFGRNRNTEFTQYLRIACGSCAEVSSHLYVALDAGLITQESFNEIREQADKTGRKITALNRYLKNTVSDQIKELPTEYTTNE